MYADYYLYNNYTVKLFLGLTSLDLYALHPHPNSKTNSQLEEAGFFFYISVFDILAKDEEMFICSMAAATPDGLYKVAQLV